MRLNNLKKRIVRKLKFLELKKKAKKLSPFFQNLKCKKFNLFDIGAGQRILPELINFDRFANVYLIDPNKNLDYSYKQLKKYFFDHKSINKYNIAISDKTSYLNYFESKISTISTFSLTKSKKNKLSKLYYPKSKKINVYSFKDFLKIYKLPKPDMIKVDVEGFELKVLHSIISCSSPLIIQIEANINNSVFTESFYSIQKKLYKKDYFLYTIFPSYGDNEFELNQIQNLPKVDLQDIETNFTKNYLLQAECYFIKKKSKYTISDFILFAGFGLSSLYLDKYKTSKKFFSKSSKRNLERIFNLIK
tara:strand:- start:559 stop:1473 length:915 start_codon:yes stop_codon:yes gene_type:complete